MNLQSRTNNRIYSFDSLRAIMMLLGLVLHSAITYQVVNEISTWPLKDSITHISNDYIVSCIHTFRMQIFFLIAGFFGSMLFYERKPLKMIKNRTKRIVLPFIVFLFLLWPTVIFSFGYSGLVFGGNLNPLEIVTSLFSNLSILILSLIHI